MTRIQANLLLLLVAMIWGSAFVAQAHVAGIGPFTFTGIRFLLGAGVVAPLAWRDFRMLSRHAARPARQDARDVVVLGLLLAFGAAFQQIGVTRTTVTNAGFLTALYVPLVPLIAWAALRERPHWSVWPASAGCLFGTWLLSGAEWSAIGGGDSWVIASSFFWALHVLLVGRIAGHLAAPFLVSVGQFLVCGVVSLAWAVFAEAITLEGIRQTAGPILYAGVLSAGVAYTGQVIGQRYAGAADAAIILSAEPVGAAVVGFLLMGERVGAAGMIGCALIFACILVVQVLPMLASRHVQEENRPRQAPEILKVPYLAKPSIKER
jgi:drug/metabolite transporter (DMT)-like permease